MSGNRKIALTTDSSGQSLVSGSNFHMPHNNDQGCIATDVNKLPGNNTTPVNNYINSNELLSKKPTTNGKKRKLNEVKYIDVKYFYVSIYIKVLNKT